MKKGLQKFAKGILGIFIIKITLLSGLLTYQACTTDEYLDNTQVRDDFLKALQRANDKVSNVAVINGNNFISKSSNEDLVELELVNTDPVKDLEITTFEDIAVLSRSGDIYMKPDEAECNDLNRHGEECFVALVDDSEAREYMQPTLSASLEYLRSNGFTNQDIIDEFGTLDSPRVIFTAMVVERMVEIDRANGIANNNTRLSNFFFNEAYAMQDIQATYYDQAVNCVLRATGLAGAGVLLNEGIKEGLKKLGVKGTLKMVGQVAGRTLSWVGIIWAVGDFIYCMSQ